MTYLDTEARREASESRRGSSYVDENDDVSGPLRDRRGRAWVVVLVGVALLAGFLLVRAGYDSGSGETVEGAGAQEAGGVPDEGYPTPEEIEAATDVLQRQIEEGWVPYGNVSAIDGSPTPPDLWVEPGFGRLDADGKKPVYDAPNGEIVGYMYSGLGYVPIELNDTFDFRAARIAEHGCDNTDRTVTCATGGP